LGDEALLVDYNELPPPEMNVKPILAPPAFEGIFEDTVYLARRIIVNRGFE
jgi:hypothetical protein